MMYGMCVPHSDKHNYYAKIGNDSGYDWVYITSPFLMRKRELVVFDMWMLMYADFMMGSWHSTLTRTLCHWRGFDRIYDGSHCWLRLKWERSSNQFQPKSEQNYDWFNLSVVDKPLLKWDSK